VSDYTTKDDIQVDDMCTNRMKLLPVVLVAIAGVAATTPMAVLDQSNTRLGRRGPPEVSKVQFAALPDKKSLPTKSHDRSSHVTPGPSILKNTGYKRPGRADWDDDATKNVWDERAKEYFSELQQQLKCLEEHQQKGIMRQKKSDNIKSYMNWLGLFKGAPQPLPL
jgi:hypothetical protein